MSIRPASGFIEPCVPIPAARAPLGPDWVYEIKHDGYRLLVRKNGERVRIYTRQGADWTDRFPRIEQAVRQLKVQSVVLDGEGVVYDDTGIPNFEYINSKLHDDEVSMVAFDLLEINGDDMRELPLILRKRQLAKVISMVRDGIEYGEHLEGQGDEIFHAVCEIGCEGIVAKRKDLPYESGRSGRWLKIKNPNSPSVKRVLSY